MENKMKITINNDIWCYIEIEESVCKYKFLSENIPECVGGYKNGTQLENYGYHKREKTLPKVVEGSVLCSSPADARQCATSIRELIERGYGEDSGWIVGLDMEDIFTHFNSEPMRFVYRRLTDFSDDESLRQICDALKDSRSLFYFFVLPERELNARLDCVNEAYQKILPDIDAQLLFQCSVGNYPDIIINVWYR